MDELTNKNATSLDSDNEDNEDNHENLMKSLGIDLKEEKVLNTTDPRSEPSKDVSVFSVMQLSDGSATSKVKLHNLMKNFKDSADTNILKKHLNKIQHPSHPLTPSLSKPETERLQRKVEYEKTSVSLRKWDQIVQKNRKSSHISYPLNQEPLHIQTVDAFLSKKSKTLTPLEEEIQALLNGNKPLEKAEKQLSIDEENSLICMSLKEARERRADLQKARALLFYQEQKNKRQKKIKSRNYHRVLRKKKKKEEGHVEDDLEHAKRLRAEERASLRHRMGSKWAKARKTMAKHDEKTKFELEEQLKKHNELVTKQIDNDSDEDDEELHKTESIVQKYNENTELYNVKGNPWLHNSTNEKSITKKEETLDHDSSLDDILPNAQICNVNSSDNTAQKKQLKKWLNEEDHQSTGHLKTHISEVETDAVKKFKDAFIEMQKNDISVNDDESPTKPKEKIETQDDEGLDEVTYNMDDVYDEKVHDAGSYSTLQNAPVDAGLSLNKISIEKSFSGNVISTSVEKPQVVENVDVEDEHRMTIEQAFADDDVLSEFKSEKQKNELENMETNDEVELPGWGVWGGSGIVPTRRKKSFKVATPLPHRKDKHLGHVVIKEDRDIHIAKHQVNLIPHPFVDKNQFERMIARPIGSTWNTPGTLSSLVKPKVSTTMGAIISPMDSNEVQETGNEEKKIQHDKNKKLNLRASRKKKLI